MTTPTSRTSDDTGWRDHRPAESKAGVPQLNCELCRRRKIKCDKSSPCSNCVKSGVPCVPIYRKRLPRGRYVTPRSPAVPDDGADELRDRIRRLEALISHMNEPRDTATSTNFTPSRPGPEIHVSAESSDIGPEKQVGKQFWAHIAEEIEGLRGIVGNSSDDEESVGSNSKSASSIGLRILGIGSFGSDAIQVTGGHLSDHNMTAQLCEVFLRQVDPVFRMIHRPSLSKFMLNGQRYLTYEPDHICARCIRSAVCYSAVASMTEEQCYRMFGTEKSAVIVEYRAACEAEIERSELLTTNDITILQSFILYLVARRTEDLSRAVWTMVALTVRIGRALSLHIDNKTDSFFNQQMRRRLWYSICVLDLQSSFEQASEPLIGPDAISSTIPLNINDSEFDVDTSSEGFQDRAGLTDMTYALVTYYAQRSGRLLNFCGRDANSFNWTEREEHVYRYEQCVLNLLKFCDPESSEYAWFAFHGAQSRVAAMRLSALRPLRRVGTKPTRRAQLTNLLNVALEVLEKVNLIRTDPRGEGFRWYIVVQWHALAIATTECFICSDVRILRNAWPIIEESFEDYKTVVEDNRQGMLKKPLEKLMEQTRRRITPLLRGQNLSGLALQPDQPGPGTSASLSTIQASYPTPTVSINTTTSHMDSPASMSLPPTYRQPQHSMDVDFHFGAANSLLSFDNSAATPSSLPQWFIPQVSYGQGRDTSSSPDGSSGTGDVSWRTWEDFVSGLSFGDFSQAPT